MIMRSYEERRKVRHVVKEKYHSLLIDVATFH